MAKRRYLLIITFFSINLFSCSYNEVFYGFNFEVYPIHSIAPSHINIMFLVDKRNLTEEVQEKIRGTMRIDLYLYWAELVPASVPLEMEKVLGWIPIESNSFMIKEEELEKGFFNEFYVKDPGMYKIQLILISSEGDKLFVSEKVFRVSTERRPF
ncbi:MAG: hypothetical protein ACUVUG_09130 [Candidatus Aminicenantia bacterium]